MTEFDYQYFKACYVGNSAELQRMGIELPKDFTFHFPRTSSSYLYTGKEYETFSSLCILSLANELWQFFRADGWKMKFDTNKVCMGFEACFDLLGKRQEDVTPDYYGMYYLKHNLLENEEWFDEKEHAALISAGHREIDIALYNAACKCDVALVEQLLQQGADASVDLYAEDLKDDLISTLEVDISVNIWFYEDFYEECYRNRILSNNIASGMLRTLFEMASSARLLRLIHEYRK